MLPNYPCRERSSNTLLTSSWVDHSLRFSWKLEIPWFTTFYHEGLRFTSIIARIHVLVAVRMSVKGAWRSNHQNWSLFDDYALGVWIQSAWFWYTSVGKSGSRSRLLWMLEIFRWDCFGNSFLALWSPSPGRETMQVSISRDYQQMKVYLDALYQTNIITFDEWYKTLVTLRRHFGLVIASWFYRATLTCYFKP